MRDRPNARELREAANLAPPEEAPLVRTALGIAARETAAGNGPVIEERARLAGYYGQAVHEEEAPARGVMRLNRRLAADIRAGRLTPAQRQAAWRLLMEVAISKLAVDAPNYPMAENHDGLGGRSPSPTVGGRRPP